MAPRLLVTSRRRSLEVDKMESRDDLRQDFIGLFGFPAVPSPLRRTLAVGIRRPPALPLRHELLLGGLWFRDAFAASSSDAAADSESAEGDSTCASGFVVSSSARVCSSCAPASTRAITRCFLALSVFLKFFVLFLQLKAVALFLSAIPDNDSAFSYAEKASTSGRSRRRSCVAVIRTWPSPTPDCLVQGVHRPATPP